ncbi:MAG: peptide-binding protein [Candidatus Hydrothermarchaeota archaeon]
MKKKTYATFLLIAILLSGCLAQPKEAEAPTKYGGTLVWGSIGDAKILNEILASDSASVDICGLVYDRLIGIDPKTLEPYPRMAESWNISEDGLTYTFHLKKGIKFHDGHEFTAEDVKFTYDTFKDPNTNAPNQADVANLESVEIIDNYTVAFHLKKPDCAFLIATGYGILPAHLLKGVDINTAEFNTRPIGTGPFKFKEWIPDDHITVVAFDDYYDGRPYLDQIIYKVVPDAIVLQEQLYTGEVDVTTIEPDQVPRFLENPNIDVYVYDTLAYGYIGFNLKNEFFKDIRVREAIAHAIDKKTIVQEVFFGYGEECNVPMAKISWAFNPNVKAPEYNVELAKKLLKEAGFEDIDGDGILEKDGKKFKFTLITNKGNKQREKIAVIVQDQLKDLGIKVEVQYLEWPTFIDKITGKDFDACVLGWGLGIDPDASSIWHSEKAGTFNFISYHNEKVNKILDEAISVPGCDKEERKELYWRFQEEIAKDYPYIFLYYRKAVVGVNKKFDSDTGIFGTPIGILWNVEKWYIKPEYRD